MSPVSRVIAAVSTALTAATEALAATGRRPHRI
jgi:hypothetical protein